MREVIDEAVVSLELEDNLSEPMLRAIEEAKAEMKALGREKAQIKVTADVAQARTDMQEAQKELRNLTGEDKKNKAAEIQGLRDVLTERQRVATATSILNREATRAAKERSDAEKAASKAASDAAKAAQQAARDKAAADKIAQQAAKDAAKAEDLARTATLRRAQDAEKAIATQQRYIAAQQRLNALTKAYSAAQGSDKIRVQVDQTAALRQMETLREQLNLMNVRPIDIKTDVTTSGTKTGVRGVLNKLGGGDDPKAIQDSIAGMKEFGKSLGQTNINIGNMNVSLAALGTALASLAPVVTGLIGALGSLISVAGSGIGGALGIGSAAITGFGMSALGMATAVKPFITSLTDAHTATTTYNAAIAKYGESSKQGKAATKAYNNELAAMPPLTRETVQGFQQLKTEWQKATQTVATHSMGDIIGASFKTVQADMGFFAKDTNASFKAVDAGWSSLMSMLRGWDKGVLSNIFGNFTASIPNITDAFNHLVDAWLRVTSSFSNYLPGLTKGFDAWAKNLDASVIKSNGFSHGVGVMVGSLQSLGHFTQEALRFLLEFFKAGVGPGQGMIDGWTKGLHGLNAEMATTAGQTKLTNFFQRSVDTTQRLFGALMPLVSAFAQWGQAMAPAANIALKLIGDVTKLTAVIVGLPGLKDVLGGALALAFLSKVSSGLFEIGSMATTVGSKLSEAFGIWSSSGKGFSNIGSSLKQAFTGTGGASAAIATSLEEGSVKIGSSITAASAEGAAMFRSAITGAGAVAAEEERAGAAGGGLTGGLGKTASAVEGEATGGLGLMGKAARGGLIGLTGIVGSQVIGSAIGGKTGSAVSTIGSTAATGAGIGSFAGPEGTFAGAVLGGLVGAFATFAASDKSTAFGKKIAEKITGPMDAATQQKYAPKLTKDFNNINQQQTLLRSIGREQSAAGAASGVAGNQMNTGNAQTPGEYAAQQKIIHQQGQAGKNAAEAFTMNYSKTPLKSVPVFLADLKSRLSDPRLGTEGRIQGAAYALQYAAGLEKNKELPKGSVNHMIQQLKSAFPGLGAYLKQQGITTSKDFVANFNFGNASQKVLDGVTDVKKYLDDYRLYAKTTGTNVGSQMKTEMDDLRSIMKNGTQSQADEAKKIYDQLVSNTKNSLDDELGVVKSRMGSIHGVIKDKTGQAAQDAQTNMSNFRQHVEDAINGGVLSSSQGSRMIQQALNATLGAFGVKQIPYPTLPKGAFKTGGQSPRGVSSTSGAAATGALMQVGHKGEVGADTVPMQVGNKPIVVAPGEQVAVFNRHQQAYMNSRLADVGGLQGMFNRVNRPHYMAAGGMVEGYAKGGNVWRVRASAEESSSGDGWTELSTNGNAAAASGHPHTATHSGGWDFATLGREYPHGTLLKIKSDSTGKAGTFPLTDIGDGSSFAPAIGLTPAVQGALGGMPNTVEISLANGQDISLASGFGSLVSGSGGFAAGGGGANAFNFVQINAPKVDTSTTLGKMVAAALGKEAKAANAYEQKVMPQVETSGGGAGRGGVPNFPVKPGKVPAQVQWALAAARNIAARHPDYGHDGAGWGKPAYDCSSYVSTVMEAAGIWQKWIDYTASGPINAKTLPGPGKWITIATRGTSGDNAHTMMEVDGHFFESSHEGLGPHVDSSWSEPFDQYRHPRGYAKGGTVNRAAGHLQHDLTQAQADMLQSARGDKRKQLLAELNPGLDTSKWANGGIAYAGEFAQGGMFTTNGPTLGLFGENGPETVMAVPHFTTGGFTTDVTNANKKTTKTKVPSPVLAGVYAGNTLPIVDPQTGRIDKDPYGNRKKTKHHAAIHPLLPRDRIGGIGTADLDAAVTAAKTDYDTYVKKVKAETDKVKETKVSKHEHVHVDKNGKKTTTYTTTKTPVTVTKKHTPTAAEKAKEKRLLNKWHSYQELDNSAQAKINNFARLESSISNIDSYLSIAGQNTDPSKADYDSAMGFWPNLRGSKKGAKTVGVESKPSMHTWDEWKKQLDALTAEHVDELKIAADEVRKKVGKFKDATSIGYVTTIEDAFGQALIDQQNEGDDTDPNKPAVPTYGTAASADDYAAILGLTDKFAKDNYAYSLAQGNNVEDDPGTPAREDLASLQDDLAAAATLEADYAGLLKYAQHDPKVLKGGPGGGPNYPLLQSVSDAYNSAQSTWQGLEDQFTQASEAAGPSNPDMYSTALGSLYSTYGGNAADVMVGGGYARGGIVSPPSTGIMDMLRGTGAASSADVSEALAGGATASRVLSAQEEGRIAPPVQSSSGSSSVVHEGHTVINHFQEPPADPHSWSKGIMWELNA